MNNEQRITLSSTVLYEKPRIRNLNITAQDILSWLAEGKSQKEILEEHPELEAEDISACLQFLAEREEQLELVFREELTAHSVVGVVTFWLLTIGMFYGAFLFFETGETFLQKVLSQPFIWIMLVPASSIGADLGIRFSKYKNFISKDLKHHISRMVGMSMGLPMFLGSIVVMVFHWLS